MQRVKTLAELMLSRALDFEVRDTPMATGLALMRATIPAGWRRAPANIEPFEQFGKIGDLYWDAPKHPIAPCLYDKNAMYVASIGAAKLGSGSYQIAGNFEDLPGLWQVKIARPAFPFDNEHAPSIGQGTIWLYTDLVKCLRPFGYEYEIVAGYIFREYHQILRQFYEKIRQARTQLATMPGPDAEQARKLLKLVYSSSLACLAHKPDRDFPGALYMPHWYYGVISHARARMLADVRAVWMGSGVLPVLVHTDTIGYEAPAPLRIGTGIGEYKEVKK